MTVTAPARDLALRFVVHGEPKTAGSKRAFVNPKTNRAIVVDDNKRTKEWQHAVKQAALEQIPIGAELLRGVPLGVEITFYMPRPQSHYGTGSRAGVLKDTAPAWHTVRPDALKMARAIEDALSGLLYHDDSAIVQEALYKRYGEPARAEVTIWRLDR